MSATQPALATRPLFVAIRPSSIVTGALVELTRAMTDAVGPALRWSPPDGYHITLHYIGEAAVLPVIDAIDRVLPVEAVTVELGPSLTELGSAIVVPAAGVDALAGRLALALAQFGPAQPDRPFQGHLTIARWRRGHSAVGVLGRPYEGRFTATEVELLASGPEPGSHESPYETIRTWPMVLG